MIPRKRIITKIHNLSRNNRYHSSEAKQVNVRRHVYDPTDQAGSVSSLILSEQVPVKRWQGPNVKRPEPRQLVKNSPWSSINTENNSNSLIREENCSSIITEENYSSLVTEDNQYTNFEAVEANLRRSVHHPANRAGSMSSFILSEQTAMRRPRGASLVDLEAWKPVKISPRSHIITEVNQYTKLSEMITPLSKVPYKKQLNIKYLQSVKFLKSLANRLEKKCVDLDTNQYGLPCDLESSVASPKWRGYRNKDEFLVHVGVDRFTPTVGFCLGNEQDLKKTVCIEPKLLVNVKPEHKETALLFQDFVQQSVLPVTEHLSRNYWRKLLVRSNVKGQLMISASLHPQKLDQSDIDREKQRLVNFFTESTNTELDLTSIYFQTCQDVGLSPHELLWGEPHLEEVQADLKLRLCPLTGLLENSSVAENLFQTLQECADVRPGTTLLDVNCGAGAASLHLSRLTNRVIGVKRTPGKIEHTYFNAETNGVSNVNFTQRQLAAVLNQLKKTDLKDLVVIINPFEHFLSRESVIIMKNIKSLRRIVYVTDQLDGRAYQNIRVLCQTSGKDYDGPQFFPVKAVPVDIYPQTNTYYFVIVFEKYSP